MKVSGLFNKKKTWVVIGVIIGWVGGFSSFVTMVIQHSHQIRGVM